MVRARPSAGACAAADPKAPYVLLVTPAMCSTGWSEKACSFEVRNSSRAGCPASVAAMARRIAGTISAGSRHALAVAAERLGHRRRSRREMSVEPYFTAGDRHHVELDRHREVVQQDGQDRDALADGRLEVHAGEADRRVAHDVDAELCRAARAWRPSPGPARSRAAWTCPSRCTSAAPSSARTARAGRAASPRRG